MECGRPPLTGKSRCLVSVCQLECVFPLTPWSHSKLGVIQLELALAGFHRGDPFPPIRAPGYMSLLLRGFFQGLHFFP